MDLFEPEILAHRLPGCDPPARPKRKRPGLPHSEKEGVALSFSAMANTALPFDLAAATAHLSATDPCLAKLIAELIPFEPEIDHNQSPYEALMEAIAYQSISGKAAATIFARIKALSANGGVPAPEEMLKLNTRQLRKAGLSGAKILSMKDLAQKKIDGIVPTHDEALKLSDEELVERLDSVRGIGILFPSGVYERPLRPGVRCETL